MIFNVCIEPSGHTFEAERGETILDCALRAGLAASYGCANGVCGECKARVVSGAVEEIRFHDYAIREAERSQGYMLMCCTAARSDLLIEASEAGGVDEIPVQALTAKVHSIERVRDGIALMRVRTPRSRVLRFLAGQSATLEFADLPPRELSIASCPCDARNLEFHIRRRPDDSFSQYVFERLKKSDEVRIEGPQGRFVFDDASTRPVVFFAYGVGFGPINGLILHAINIEAAQAMRLYWYAPDEGAHYMDNYCRAWADALDDFSYTPLAGGDEIAAVHRVTADCSDLRGVDLYVVGPREFTDHAKALFLAHGAASDRTFIEMLR